VHLYYKNVKIKTATAIKNYFLTTILTTSTNSYGDHLFVFRKEQPRSCYLGTSYVHSRTRNRPFPGGYNTWRLYTVVLKSVQAKKKNQADESSWRHPKYHCKVSTAVTDDADVDSIAQGFCLIPEEISPTSEHPSCHDTPFSANAVSRSETLTHKQETSTETTMNGR